MNPNSQNNSYQRYSYVRPSISTSSQNSYYQYYNHHRRPQQFRYSNGAAINTYAFSHLQQWYQPSVGISDLAEPISVFDDLRYPPHRPSDVFPFPSVYTPPNPTRRIPAISNERLATASAMRERLLNDIQQNINEIDREITSLEQRSTFSQYISSRRSPFGVSQRKSLDKLTVSTNDIDPALQEKPRKVYNVIPRIASQPTKVSSLQATSNLTEETTSQLIFSHYHYAAEAEEVQIDERDPENDDMISFVNEIPRAKSVELVSLESVHRDQSAFSEHRALIFVPQYIDNDQTETTEDFHQSDAIDAVATEVSLVHSSDHPGSSNKLNIEDFQSLTHTAPEQVPATPHRPPPSSREPKSGDVPEKKGADLINTLLSKPVKHAHLSTKAEEIHSSSQQAIVNPKNNTDVDTAYFFSDYGESGEGEEDLISIDPRQFEIPADEELFPEDNVSHFQIRQSQTSLLNPHSSEEQQQRKPIIRNNNEHVEETESEKIDSTTKYIITSPSSASSKKLFPISIYDSMQTQSIHENSNVNEHQYESLPTTIDNNPIEQSTENRFNHSMTSKRQISSRSKDTPTEQRSASPRRSIQNQVVYEFSRDASISPMDIHESRGGGESNRSRSNSPLPIPRNSPDFNTNRPSSTSRPSTPERRDSIPYLDQSTLMTSVYILDLGEQGIEHSTTNPDDDPPSVLEKGILGSKTSSNEDQVEDNRTPSPFIPEQHTRRLESVSPMDVETKQWEHNFLESPPVSNNRQEFDRSRKAELKPKMVIKDESEEYPSITESQKRSKLSLQIHQPRSREQKPIPTRKHITVPTDDEKTDRHVVFSKEIIYSPVEERNPTNDWRERIDRVLSKKRFPRNKYAHIKSRVNSFENFAYRSRRFDIGSRAKSRSKSEPGRTRQDQTETNPLAKGTSSLIFGRLRSTPDGRPQIFSEKLQWNAQSKLKAYSLENLHYKSRPKKTLIKKPRWDSESRIVAHDKPTPRDPIATRTISIPIIIDELPTLDNEMKIFDVKSSEQVQEGWFTDHSWTSKRSEKLIFGEKLAWRKRSKLKDLIWGNINYQSKKSTVQIFHQPTHWNRQSKLRLTQSLTLDIQAKVHYLSGPDLDQLTRKKALFSQYHSLQWNDITNDHLHSIDDHYPLLSAREDFRDNSEENLDNPTEEESPANRPKWNAVSKTRSVNTVYNPKLSNANAIRRGWDLDLRRKRVHQLPPIKRKKVRSTIPQLTSEAPPTNQSLAIEYSDNHSVHNQTASIEYAFTPSRRSSKALVPLPPLPDFRLLSDTPRSQRPVQQEWYDELNKSRSTQRTEIVRLRHNSFQDSMGSLQPTITPRELRPSTRNSQTSVVVSAVLDSSIRTNRATELRLSRDMDEHHQHSHEPHQSMPFEIRGFRLEGTTLTVPDHATIRPLSNVSYHTSERVKTRRLYPWSVLHPNGTNSRNSSLLPITEMQHPSLAASLAGTPPLLNEE